MEEHLAPIYQYEKSGSDNSDFSDDSNDDDSDIETILAGEEDGNELMNNSSSTDHKSNTALFISTPFIGHINPLLRQAIELYQRHHNDYNIYIISCSNIKTYIETNCLNTTIKFLDIGYCYNETEIRLDFEEMSLQPNTLSSKLLSMKLLLEKIYPQMYEQMLKTIQPDIFNKQDKVIAIIDLLTYAGTDIANHFNINYIINNADLLPYLGWYDVLPSDYNPTSIIHPPQSIHTLHTNLFFRTILPITRYLITIFVYFQFDRPLNYIRQTKFHFNNSIHLLSRYHSHLVLVNSVFGIEYAQHLPPYVQCTGPMLSMKLSPNHYLTQLSEDDRQWLEMDSRPIIYINFGTVVTLTNEQIQKIFFALKSSDKYRIVWKLHQRNLLPIKLPSTFRIVQWISSTLGYLAHPNVKLFISHCGINSAYESIWLGTSILCLPFLADQHDMAQRLVDAGIGQWLDNLHFTSEQLNQTIENMFQEKEYLIRQKNIKRIQTIMRLHGGVERAVDLIEMTAEYGIDSFIPKNNYYPWYAYYNLDIYAIWLFTCFIFLQLIKCCCCRCYKSSTKTSIKIKTS